MADLTRDDLDRLDALAAEATEGPWTTRYNGAGYVVHTPETDVWETYALPESDAALAAALVNAYPRLRDALRAAWADVERLTQERDALQARLDAGIAACRREGACDRPTDHGEWVATRILAALEGRDGT